MGAALALATSFEEEEQEKKSSNLSKDEIIKFARDAILNYFDGRDYYCGGEIPHHLLVAKKRISLVLDCTFDEAMSVAYEAMEADLTSEDDEYIAAGGVSPDIKKLVDVLHEMARYGVPQELSNGMLILHLELCMGVDVVYA